MIEIKDEPINTKIVYKFYAKLYDNNSKKEMTTNSTPTLNDTTNVCVSVNPESSLVIVIFPILQIIINVFVIIAVIQSRRRLRHNFVYLYVINLLTANVLFGIFSGYQFLVYNTSIESIEGYPNSNMYYPTHTALKNWWAFRSGFTTSLFLIMNGSISALIHGIRESSYFVGKSSIHFAKKSKGLPQNAALKNTSSTFYRMMVLVFVVWFIPLLFTIAATAGWSCADRCFCTYGNYGFDVYFCHSDVIRECSRFYQPQRNDFMLAIVCVWFIQTLGIVYMNITTLKKYVKVMRRSNPHRGNINSTPGTAATTSGFSSLTIKKRCLPQLNRNMKLLLILSASFFLSTLPIMIISLIDVISPTYILSYIATIIAFMLVLIYCTVCPILLVFYMAGLRDAVRRILFRCCTVTVTTNHSTTASAERSDDS